MDRKWEVQSKVNSENLTTENVVEVLLQNRGLISSKEIKEFLDPDLSKISIDSVGINKINLNKALKRIKKAIEDKENIVVFGDYDVDGICGTAILWETIYSFTKNVYPYIPHRIDEGYGLSIAGIKNLQAQMPEVKLIITVDNGIVANDAVEFANENGIDVIITDHHVQSKKLPKAYSIVHTTKLCGTSVAWMLSQEILKKIQNDAKIEIQDHLELVALATVADLVPLKEANRTLLKFGLEQLRKTKRVGILELCKEAAIDIAKIGTYEIGHIIAPRLNAMGRLEYAMDSLRLVCTKDRKRAENLAQLLGNTNKERQLLTAETVAAAKLKVESSRLHVKKLLFIADETYQPGVIGLVAGRLVEEFYLPSIVVSKGEKHSKASARSIAGFNIIDFIRSAADLLVDVGGHPMAAGFTVETAKLELLEDKLMKLANDLITAELLKRSIKIDCELPLEIISQDFYDRIEKLAPFGIGNPQPVFVSRNLQIVDMRLVGKDSKHLRLKLKHNTVNLTIDCIGFGLGAKVADHKIGDKADVVYSIALDEWSGQKRLQLKIKDIKASSELELVS